MFWWNWEDHSTSKEQWTKISLRVICDQKGAVRLLTADFWGDVDLLEWVEVGVCRVCSCFIGISALNLMWAASGASVEMWKINGKSELSAYKLAKFVSDMEDLNCPQNPELRWTFQSERCLHPKPVPDLIDALVSCVNFFDSLPRKIEGKFKSAGFGVRIL